jgi:hypothetical protein
MAVFNKNTLTQVSGFDNQIIAGELVWQQKTFWNLALNADNGTPLDLTGATIEAEIIRRTLTNVRDSRYGLAFDIENYDPTPTVINLPITNVVEENGSFTLSLDSDTWDLIVGQVGLDIDNINGIGFSGRIKIAFPASGSTPANDLIIFLLFLVRSDAIVNN